jgi:hypothetical protein
MMSVPGQERVAAGIATFPATGPRVNAGPADDKRGPDEADEQATA